MKLNISTPEKAVRCQNGNGQLYYIDQTNDLFRFDFLNCFSSSHDTDNRMLKGQATLQIDIIWLPQWTIGTKLNRCTLYKCTGSHYDLILITWHIPWLWCGEINDALR